jgi:hypothetical protein
MIRHKRRIKRRPGVEIVIDIDGFGGRRAKVSKYRHFTRRSRGLGLRNGIKLFYHEDTNLMSPRRVLRLRPRPDLVVYE